MGSQRFAWGRRVVLVDIYFAVLRSIATYIRHWVVLVLWSGLLLGVLAGAVARPRGRSLAPFSFLGWIVPGAALGMLAGQMTWTAFLVMAIVSANYLAYNWDRPWPPPSAPDEPAFKDPVFTGAVIGLVAGGSLVLLTLANAIPEVWLGPSCGASGFALAVFVIAVARWQIGS